MNYPSLPKSIHQKIKSFESEFDKIPEKRKELLETLSHYISQKIEKKETVKIIVICTHNSRRSHIGQLWLQAGSAYMGIDDFQTFSGGTEATAFNHRSVSALKRVGFELNKKTEDNNPKYESTLPSNAGEPLLLFSKKYDAPPNPLNGFAAVMVCSEADEACPFVPGAEARFAIPFDDPKNFDNTVLEATKYDERVEQMGREFFFVLKSVK